MKVFLTGGTGFIGKHVVKILLNEGHKILLLKRPSNLKYSYLDRVQVTSGDLSTIQDCKKKIKDFEPDSAIHLAWEGIPDYSAETSTKNLKNTAIKNKIIKLGIRPCNKKNTIVFFKKYVNTFVN